MNFPAHQLHRVDTSEMPQGVAASRMPEQTTTARAPNQDDDIREIWVITGFVLFVATGVLAASAFLGYLLWRAFPVLPF